MKEDLELLMARVEQMRSAQSEYFKHCRGPSSETWLKKSKALESAVDELLKNLRRKGLNPDPFKVTNEQQGLF